MKRALWTEFCTVSSRLLRSLFFLIGGLVVAAATAIDVVWTTLGTHGGGPISGRVTTVFWKIALAIHKRRPHHRLLSFAGSIMLVILLWTWTALIWLAGVLVFSASPSSIVNMQTHVPADLAGRIYYVGGSMFTLGSGDLVPNGGLWRVVTSLMSGFGIGTLTLAITFLLQVLASVVAKRKIGAYITDLGGTPAKIISRSWTGENFDSLTNHFLNLTGMLHQYAEEHLAYPILHFFHSENERTAATLRVAGLNEIVLLLAEGAAPEVRLPPLVIEPVRGALNGLIDVVAAEFVVPADEAPPVPRLSILRDIGVPTVDDETWVAAMKKADRIRRTMAGLLQDDGWPWQRIHEADENRK